MASHGRFPGASAPSGLRRAVASRSGSEPMAGRSSIVPLTAGTPSPAMDKFTRKRNRLPKPCNSNSRWAMVGTFDDGERLSVGVAKQTSQRRRILSLSSPNPMLCGSSSPECVLRPLNRRNGSMTFAGAAAQGREERSSIRVLALFTVRSQRCKKPKTPLSGTCCRKAGRRAARDPVVQQPQSRSPYGRQCR